MFVLVIFCLFWFQSLVSCYDFILFWGVEGGSFIIGDMTTSCVSTERYWVFRFTLIVLIIMCKLWINCSCFFLYPSSRKVVAFEICWQWTQWVRDASQSKVSCCCYCCCCLRKNIELLHNKLIRKSAWMTLLQNICNKWEPKNGSNWIDR